MRAVRRQAAEIFAAGISTTGILTTILTDGFSPYQTVGIEQAVSSLQVVAEIGGFPIE